MYTHITSRHYCHELVHFIVFNHAAMKKLHSLQLRIRVPETDINDRQSSNVLSLLAMGRKLQVKGLAVAANWYAPLALAWWVMVSRWEQNYIHSALPNWWFACCLRLHLMQSLYLCLSVRVSYNDYRWNTWYTRFGESQVSWMKPLLFDILWHKNLPSLQNYEKVKCSYGFNYFLVTVFNEL